jgi:hypothetical protein
MIRALSLFLLFPLWLPAQERSVPAGTDGNRLILSIGNSGSVPVRSVRVAVRSAPAWVVFKNALVVLDEIYANGWAEAEFEFAVLESEAERKEAVQFAITDESGTLLGTRTIKLRTTFLPQKTTLHTPYPNPGNPGSTIEYALHAPSHVKLEIYNMLGQRVRTLVDEEKPAGKTSITWDGKNDEGLAVASGVYIVKLHATEKGSNLVNQLTSKIMIQK